MTATATASSTTIDSTSAAPARRTIANRITAAAKSRRTAARALVAGGIAAATMFVGVSSASAAVVSASGQYGPTAVSQGSCSYMRSNTSGWLRTVTAGPTVWARDNQWGWGNDAQRVRYRAVALEAGTGRVLSVTPYTGLVWAWDNYPARWTGSTTFDMDWRLNFQVVYQIQWVDGYGTVIGEAFEVINSYKYYSNAVGPYGPISSCMKYI